MSNAFIVLLGFGTVFFGLVCLVFIIVLMGKIIGLLEKKKAAAAAAALADEAELNAVITAALAKDLGTDESKIKIRSVKSVD